jgi:PilZ domain
MSLPVRYPGGTGVTRDVSAAGVYFLSEDSFVEGQQVSLTITLEHSSPEGSLDVTYRGRVVRVVRAEESDLGTGAEALRGVAIAGDTDVLGVATMAVNGVGASPVS